LIRNTIKRALQKAGLLNYAATTRDWIKSIKLLPANYRYWIHPPDGSPIPPLRLIKAVTGQPDIEWFLKSGALAAGAICATLQRNGIVLNERTDVLDFGCGCGRVIRHFNAKAQCFGSDYNESAIDWCKNNLRFGTFIQNDLEPPLRFGDQQFDLVYALSVFTHLPESLQRKWLEEFYRILRPGGHLLLTTHGEYYLPILNPAEKEEFFADRLVTRADREPGSNPYCSYQSYAFTESIAHEYFQIVNFVPEGALGNPRQDLYFLRKTTEARSHGD
jgi:SAM-dependent methyltransferase